MKRTAANPFAPMSLVVGFSGMLLGLTTGYIVGAGQVQATPRVATAAPVDQDHDHVHTTGPQPHFVSEAELKAFRDIVEQDPQNVKAAVELANRLYDANRFGEAIPYYRKALALDPGNVNVSTDLGTALYYVGRPDEALAQFEVSLDIQPGHAQTLYNIGIVRRDAKRDAAGAVAAWEQLLEAQPGYPEAARVRALINDTQG
jgi:cytochrome c-type biogenesis protein CcmH/NrfG